MYGQPLQCILTLIAFSTSQLEASTIHTLLVRPRHQTLMAGQYIYGDKFSPKLRLGFCVLKDCDRYHWGGRRGPVQQQHILLV